MTVRVAEEGPDLTAAIESRGQEIGSSLAEELEGAMTVATRNMISELTRSGRIGHVRIFGARA